MYKPDLILQQLTKQYGIRILTQIHLKGLILDMMPTAERKHINVMKRAIDEQIGTKLLEIQHDDPAVRQIKINTLKEKFRKDNAFDDTAYYIVDCFLNALGWNTPEPEILLPFKEIKIGKQIWADRNLDVSHFRNGDPIPEARTNEEWIEAGKNEQPAWCYYDNDTENGKVYGKLYNWYAVNDPRGLAPEGWIVPSDDEWDVLVEHLGGPRKAGYKLKYNANGIDDVVFSALPGGSRGPSGSFGGLGDSPPCWWSSTQFDAVYAMWWSLRNENSNVSSFFFSKDCGFSIRCVRDY